MLQLEIMKIYTEDMRACYRVGQTSVTLHFSQNFLFLFLFSYLTGKLICRLYIVHAKLQVLLVSFIYRYKCLQTKCDHR